MLYAVSHKKKKNRLRRTGGSALCIGGTYLPRMPELVSTVASGMAETRISGRVCADGRDSTRLTDENDSYRLSVELRCLTKARAMGVISLHLCAQKQDRRKAVHWRT